MKAWLRLFRVVNLPTVPGDLLVAAAICGNMALGVDLAYYIRLGAASLAAVLIYMASLADNDIIGAPTDCARPIPEGLITVKAAKVARLGCILGAFAIAIAAKLPVLWWGAASSLVAAAAAYNRTKSAFLMGYCRGANVFCGAAAVCGFGIIDLDIRRIAILGAAVLMWIGYFAFVTKYSEGEEEDEEKKRRVGILIGSVLYLQLIWLIAFPARALLLAGAALLIALRILKETAKGVSAS